MASSSPVALLFLAALSLSAAHCPNFCNGHGDCVGQNKCACFDHWMGGDCSLRRCPFGPAWSDIATSTDTAHQSAECSNRGVCDHTTGLCSCMPGYEGVACTRMTCPDDCNNHGTCRSMAYHASRKDPSTGTVYTYSNIWDAHLIHGCECDEGWEGFDCSQRVCAHGDDELTTGQVNEVQVFRCLLDGSAGEEEFYLTYLGQTTVAIPWDADADTFRDALNALSTINQVDVRYIDAGTTACTRTNLVEIEFTQDFGDVPNILAHDATGYPSALDTAPDVVIDRTSFGYNGFDDSTPPEVQGMTSTDSALHATISVRGTKESAPCSNRGDCNPSSGVCECYTGFVTSDGNLNSGTRGDCAFAQDPIERCPGDTECSGHGVCSGFPQYTCDCQAGWTNGDCNSRTCPEGRSWFEFPTADETAHFSLVECSNKGVCDRETGTCTCQDLFEGEACERMTCPGQTGDAVCHGHGRCLTMSRLAEFNEDNGDLKEQTYGLVPNKAETWDFRSVYGCLCDDGFEGYDCSERTCEFGDDATTKLQTEEQQHFRCAQQAGGVDDVSADTFTLTFRQHTTEPILSTATAAEVEAALEALDSVDDVSVQINVGSEICPETGTDFVLLFHTPSGDLPNVVLRRTLLDSSKLQFLLQYFPPSEDIEPTPPSDGLGSADATTEYDECNGRGLCDHSEGLCKCLDGFGASDGRGAAGSRPDCGHLLEYVPVKMNQPAW